MREPMRLMAYQAYMLVARRDLEGDHKCVVHGVDDRHLFGLAVGPPYLDECAGHPGIVTHGPRRGHPNFSVHLACTDSRHSGGPQPGNIRLGPTDCFCATPGPARG